MDDRRVQTTQYRVKQVMVDRRSYTGVHSHTGTLKAPRGARDVCVWGGGVCTSTRHSTYQAVAELNHGVG
jgi:hypothetical protein